MKSFCVRVHLFLAVVIVGWPLSVEAQTLFVPGGTLGTSSTSHVGIGTGSPSARLHVGGSNQEIRFDYNGSDSYYGSLRWSGLQLGNNGQNRIVAGRTSAGGWLDFFVNNTNEGADYSQYPNGILALHIHKNGNVGIGTTDPTVRLDVSGTAQAQQFAVSNVGQIFTLAKSGISEVMVANDNSSDAYFEVGSANSSTRAHHGVLTLWGSESGGWANRMDLIQVGGAYGLVAAKGGLILQPTSGYVGIGTTNPTHKLSVNGTIRAKEVIVEASPWPDDVFERGYKLTTLSEVAAHIEAEGHLPDVPSAATIAEEGVTLGEMQKTLVRKIEELTLYVIAQEKRNEEQDERIEQLERENEALRGLQQ